MKRAIHHVDPRNPPNLSSAIQVDPREHVGKPTRVTFRRLKADGSVIAFMIDEPARLGYMASYSRTLGWAEANYWGLLNHTVPCKANDYDGLDDDLKRMNFNIKVISRVRQREGRNRRYR
jgi:hypothetical protein